MTRPAGSVEATNFTYVIKQLELAVRPHFNELCASVGMTPAQFTALTVLSRWPGITSSELARRTFVRAQSMATTIEPLLESGLLRREQDPEHARRMLLFLTPEGAKIAATLTPRVAEVDQLLLDGFTDAEIGQFQDYLRRARHSISARHHVSS